MLYPSSVLVTSHSSNLVIFLAADESSFITAETVNINGGYYMD